MRFLMPIYSALLALGLLVHTLVRLRTMLASLTKREEWRQRFGRVPRALVDAVRGKRVVWLHAVSVGETLAAQRLVAELGEALGPGFLIVISTTTRTGQALARERFGADRVFFMPLDFAFSMRAYLNALRPEAIILMESEVWPRMMHECARRGIPTVVVNARVSDRSFHRSRYVRWIWSHVLRQATLWLAQSEEDARRLIAMGANPDAVHVGGNLKYDIRSPQTSPVVQAIQEVAGARSIVVAGSTTASTQPDQNDEEEDLAAIWKQVQQQIPDALLILAPRHPERFDKAIDYFSDFNLLRASQLSGQNNWKRPDIICLDTIGDLASMYSAATVAFVGGSLTSRGGHNPLEPAQFRVPVVMGPSYENFREIVVRMRQEKAIYIAGQTSTDEPKQNGFVLDEVRAAFVALLTNPAEARAMGERGRQVFLSQQGATRRAVEAITTLIATRGAAQ